MPIRPENKSRYPKNWKEIRAKILERASQKCEFCGVKNHAIGVRGYDGEFYEEGTWEADSLFYGAEKAKPIKIVLTIMHLNHQPEDNRDENLKAGCQRCHNRYDMPHRIANRKKNRNKNK